MKKTCLDCLHCKVSCKSKKNNILCFCSLSVKKKTYLDIFWSEKKPCKDFFDMTEDITLVVSNTVTDNKIAPVWDKSLMRA